MNEAIDPLRSMPSRLEEAVRGIAESDLRRIEAEGKWSVVDVISHLTEFEAIVGVRIRSIVAVDHPPLTALAQNAWVERVQRGEPLAELLERLFFYRRTNILFFERLRDDEWTRTGEHPEYGSLTMNDVLERVRNHDAKHLRQIERIKTTLGI